MIQEKEITINGQQIKMIYCSATESGYEEISRKSISVFVPEFGKDDEGNTIIVKQAEATIGDFVSLAFAGIVAAYVRDKKDVPVTSEYILYEATPAERNDLLTAIVELRNAWYHVPEVIKPEFDEKGGEDNHPNAQPPTTSSKK